MPYDTMTSSFVHPDVIRGQFCSALSNMYRKEVPLYGDLVELVNEVNEQVRAQGGSWEIAQRLGVERHGAIRLGKPSELAFIARLFRVMGMHPVGYYDLSTAGVPVHATAFRPITPSALAANPFRVFTSLLRPELIVDAQLRKEAMSILDKREIFHPTVRALVAKAEDEGGLDEREAAELVRFALETFRWHETALVDETTYRKLKATHPLIADITGFQGPHINHLTPRVLDIDAAQDGMVKRGIPPKQIIEGPPKRSCPILLRQTSFQALSEPIKFPGGQTDGSHRARFGEIESRGVALTRKGHQLYLDLQEKNRILAGQSTPTDDNAKHQARLSRTFQPFPDSWTELRRGQLAFFTYSLAFHSVTPRLDKTLEELIMDGLVIATPVVYEDFLPASAAGIFQSNLGEHEQRTLGGDSRQAEFEQSLGRKVEDYFEMYEKMQEESIQEVIRLTGCKRG